MGVGVGPEHLRPLGRGPTALRPALCRGRLRAVRLRWLLLRRVTGLAAVRPRWLRLLRIGLLLAVALRVVLPSIAGLTVGLLLAIAITGRLPVRLLPVGLRVVGRLPVGLRVVGRLPVGLGIVGRLPVGLLLSVGRPAPARLGRRCLLPGELRVPLLHGVDLAVEL